MSGFEVVGLVLSLYPVVIDALRVYQSVRSGEWIAGIAKALQVEEVVYEEFVEILLKPNVSEAELVALMSMKYKSPELERWRDTDLHLRLSKFFGPKKARAILSKLEDIQVELESIRSDLASFTTGGVSFRSMLLTVLANNQLCKGHLSNTSEPCDHRFQACPSRFGLQRTPEKVDLT